MKPRALFVDDDVNLLQGLQRALRHELAVLTAPGGRAALEIIAREEPFPVVVSDMRMPEMNGVEFLKEVQARAPDTVRIMLTGDGDMRTAAEAVNEGHIFRFLCKPCPTDDLLKAVVAGIGQHRLIVTERELLEQTLRGAVKVLAEVLGLINPVAFGRASRIAGYVRHVAARVGLPNAWQFEVAALLSQLGCVALLPETVEAYYLGQLSEADAKKFLEHPQLTRDLLAKIPRLEGVAEMIARQYAPVKAQHPQPLSSRNPVEVGAELLHLAQELDRRLLQGFSLQQALQSFRLGVGGYDRTLVGALADVVLDPQALGVKVLPISRLVPGMILDENVRTKGGMLLVMRGQEVTAPMLERLRNFWRMNAIPEQVRVTLSTEAEASSARDEPAAS